MIIVNREMMKRTGRAMPYVKVTKIVLNMKAYCKGRYSAKSGPEWLLMYSAIVTDFVLLLSLEQIDP